jgi:predicted nucleic acid-binding protein
VGAPLYLDTSAVLRATLEAGTTPEVERAIAAAPVLLTSRLSLVEASRALLRARSALRVPELRLADAEREIESIWDRCDIWELTAPVCEAARVVAPALALRSLDALHLATFLAARRRIPGLSMLTVDDRLRLACGA